MTSHYFNPYQILGVARTAPDEVIRAAFRVLTQKYHPDRNSAPDADTRTAEIIRAYELLRDPEARARYDRDAERSQGDANGGDDTGAPPASDAGLAEPYVCEEGSVFETEYAILVQPAIVREHSVSYVPQQVERSDQRPFVGKGRYVETVHTARQQIWLKLAHVDRNLVHEGSELEVAVGHRVTLLSVFRPGASRRPVDAVLVNHSTNQWLELESLSKVAVAIKHPRDSARRFSRAALWTAGGFAMLYLLIRLNVIDWIFALLLGVPATVLITGMLTDKEGRELTKAIQGALLRAA